MKVEYYYENPKKKGQCKGCKKLGKKDNVEIYGVYIKDGGWFRGDDTYAGKYCMECIIKLLKEKE